MLLDDVSGFMRDQGEIGWVFALAEENVIAEGESASGKRLGLSLRRSAGVEPHRAKVD